MLTGHPEEDNPARFCRNAESADRRHRQSEARVCDVVANGTVSEVNARCRSRGAWRRRSVAEDRYEHDRRVLAERVTMTRPKRK